MDAGYTATVRATRGDDIDAACGQLAGQVNDRTRRAERHQARYKLDTAALLKSNTDIIPVKLVNE